MFGTGRWPRSVLNSQRHQDSRKHQYVALASAGVLAITSLCLPIPAGSSNSVVKPAGARTSYRAKTIDSNDPYKRPGVVVPRPGEEPKIVTPPDEVPAIPPPASRRDLTGPLPQLGPAPAPSRPIKLNAYGGSVPTVVRVPTSKKIAFITIDDGGYRPERAPDLLAQARVPTSQFLIYGAVHPYRDYFRKLQSNGSTIQNHTLSHKKVSELPEARQREEICTAHAKLGAFAGRKPTLFRPPYGEYNATTLKVLRECGGVQANVLWEASMYGGSMYITNKLGDGDDKQLKPGMIILLHFSENFETDLRGALNRLKKDGYTVARLEDYITA